MSSKHELQEVYSTGLFVNTLACIYCILLDADTFLVASSKLSLSHRYSSSFKHLGFLYLNNLFSFSLRSSQPQSSPAINLTTLSIPVAFNTFSTLSPKPLAFGLRFLVCFGLLYISILFTKFN